VKVDNEKAYDLVDRQFMYYMMGNLGFCSKWIGRIKACVESSMVSVLVTESPTQEIKPSKGLRQGDPVTQFQLLIVVEGLVGLVRQGTKKQNVKVLGLEKEKY